MSILIVDDSQMFRTAIKTELSQSHTRILEAKDHFECMDLLDPEVKLILLDIELPEKTGFEIYEMIREYEKKENPDPLNRPIIFLSSSDSIDNRVKGFELGALDFISKDFEEGELALLVEKVLNPQKRFEQYTALAVEDSAIYLKVVKMLLANMGFQILTAKDGKEGLDIYTEKQDKIDIIITDQNMPNMTGIELTRAIRNSLGDKDVPIVILSAVDEKKIVPEFFKAGASDYITKPYIKEEFIARLESLVESYSIKKLLRTDIKKQKDINKLKDKFLAICSHDLRSPLNSILGYSEILEEDDELTPEEQKEFLQRISKAGKFLLSLINDLLDLQKMGLEQEFNWKPQIIREILENATEQMQGQADHKHIQIKIQNELMEDVLVNLDTNAITRCFNNLLSNAIKFTPKGKKITIHVKHEDEFHITIDFIDEGQGIPEEDIKGLFNKFTKSSKKGTEGEVGTGLGLSIVKEIITKHEGTITVSSDGEGKGSKFSITLPIIPSNQ